jgi:DNA-binding NarL/FixJ family response regulator
MERKHLLVVSNFSIFKEGILSIMKEFKRYDVFTTSFDTIENYFLDHKYEIIIIDFSSRKQFDFNQLINLAKERPALKIFFVISNQLEINIINKLPLDFFGIVYYHASKEEFQKAIQVISKGRKFYSNEIKANYFQNSNKNLFSTSNYSDLTKREKQIVLLFAKGLLAKDIAMSLNLSYLTVNTHRKNILRKLNLNSTTEIIVFAMNLGLQ